VNAARQVHCLLDCLSFIAQERNVEERPVYLGVWDAPISIGETGISYFSNSMDSEGLLGRFERLYGATVRSWIRYDKDIESNFLELERIMESRKDDEYVIVLVDLYFLPYHPPSYLKKHRPHIVLLAGRTEGGWRIADPFFDWEGFVSNETMKESFLFEELKLGFIVDASGLRHPDRAEIVAYFSSFDERLPSQVIHELEAAIRRTMSNDEAHPASRLYESIEQAGVIAKRWRGYDLLASYFEASNESVTGQVDDLMKRWESMLLHVVRIGITGNTSSFEALLRKKEQIGEQEIAIKQTLRALYEAWEGSDRHAG